MRGTPQQIIEKYQTLARDAQLSGDRVAAENFLQHSEHYARLLSEAQREIAERQAAEAQSRQQQPVPNGAGGGGGRPQQPQAGDVIDGASVASGDGPGLVETPESTAGGDEPQGRQRRGRPRRAAQPDGPDDGDSAEAGGAKPGEVADTPIQ